jgi:hypothetical protein
MFMGCLENYPQKGFKAGVLKALVISRNDLDPSLLMRFKSVFKEENKDRKKERKREGRKGGKREEKERKGREGKGRGRKERREAVSYGESPT